MGTVKFIWKVSMFKLEHLCSVKLTDFAFGRDTNFLADLYPELAWWVLGASSIPTQQGSLPWADNALEPMWVFAGSASLGMAQAARWPRLCGTHCRRNGRWGAGGPVPDPGGGPGRDAARSEPCFTVITHRGQQTKESENWNHLTVGKSRFFYRGGKSDTEKFSGLFKVTNNQVSELKLESVLFITAFLRALSAFKTYAL